MACWTRSSFALRLKSQSFQYVNAPAHGIFCALHHRGQRQIPLLSIHTVSLYKRARAGGFGSTSHGEAMRSDRIIDNKKKSAATKNGHASPLDKDYRPSDKEPFMNERQRE